MTAHRGRYGRYVHNVLSLLDLVLVNLLFWLLCMTSPEVSEHYLRLKILLANISYLPIPFWFSRIRNNRAIHIDRIVSGSLQAVGIHALFFISMLSFLGDNDISIAEWLEFYGMMAVCFPMSWAVSRLFLKWYRNRGGNFSRVVIVGTNNTAARLNDAMLSDAGYGFKMMGFFGPEPTTALSGDYIGPVELLGDFVRDNSVDEIYYTMSGEDDEALHHVVRIADDNVVSLFFVPQLSVYMGRRFLMSNIGQIPLLSERRNPMNNLFNKMLKRSFDVLFSSVVLLFSPLVFIPVAIAIKLSSPGPVFFRQERTGYRGRSFKCWKFRTMKVNADSDRFQASRNDPRKTRVGDFLRRTSIDELPQFINVIKGDMSVVGPRPHMLKHTHDYSALIDRYMLRHVVKPGITGWAQVNGFRGQTDELWKMEQRVAHDVWYVENWTFMLDMKIILRTVINALQGEQNAF